MHIPITAVALRTIRHNDRSSILTAWTPQLGRISLLLPAGNSAQSRRRRAITMPLSLFEGVVGAKQNREILFIRDMKASSHGKALLDISSNPVRSTVAMFISEVLSIVTREGDADPLLWKLIVDTTSVLAKSQSTTLANLPAAFLVRLSSVLGLEPDFSEYHRGQGFDMVDGLFRAMRPFHDFWIPADKMPWINIFIQTCEDYKHLGLMRLSKHNRNELLSGLMQYFSLHHYPLDKLKSLSVLKSVFGT